VGEYQSGVSITPNNETIEQLQLRDFNYRTSSHHTQLQLHSPYVDDLQHTEYWQILLKYMDISGNENQKWLLYGHFKLD